MEYLLTLAADPVVCDGAFTDYGDRGDCGGIGDAAGGNAIVELRQ